MRHNRLFTAFLGLVSVLILSACDGASSNVGPKYQRGGTDSEPRTVGMGLERVVERMKPRKGLKPKTKQLSGRDPFLYAEIPPLAPPPDPGLFPPRPPGSLPPMYISRKIELPPQVRPDMATHIPSLVGGTLENQSSDIIISKDNNAAPIVSEPSPSRELIEDNMMADSKFKGPVIDELMIEPIANDIEDPVNEAVIKDEISEVDMPKEPSEDKTSVEDVPLMSRSEKQLESMISASKENSKLPLKQKNQQEEFDREAADSLEKRLFGYK